nr:MAG TPA: hypothetical protein [Caudoviricetes sp.]
MTYREKGLARNSKSFFMQKIGCINLFTKNFMQCI